MFTVDKKNLQKYSVTVYPHYFTYIYKCPINSIVSRIAFILYKYSVVHRWQKAIPPNSLTFIEKDSAISICWLFHYSSALKIIYKMGFRRSFQETSILKLYVQSNKKVMNHRKKYWQLQESLFNSAKSLDPVLLTQKPTCF